MAPEYANITRARIHNLKPFYSFAATPHSDQHRSPAITVTTSASKTITKNLPSSSSSKQITPSFSAQRPRSDAITAVPATKVVPATEVTQAVTKGPKAPSSSQSTLSRQTPLPSLAIPLVTKAAHKEPEPIAPSSPPTFHHFPHLPLELREQIYLEAILTHNPSSFSDRIYADSTRSQQRGITHFKNCLPGICFTNKSKGRIAAAVFVRYATFYMYRDSDVDVMREWLEKWGLKTIMCVEVFPSANYRKGGLGRDVEFLRACKGLQTIKITLPLRTLQLRFHLKNPYAVSGPATLKALELADIIKVKSLKRIEIKISDHLVRIPRGVKEAAEWIRAGCEKKGRKVVVDVVLQEVSLERMREIRSWDVMGF